MDSIARDEQAPFDLGVLLAGRTVKEPRANPGTFKGIESRQLMPEVQAIDSDALFGGFQKR